MTITRPILYGWAFFVRSLGVTDRDVSLPLAAKLFARVLNIRRVRAIPISLDDEDVPRDEVSQRA